MKTCPNCSAPIEDNSKFCVYCGTKFENKTCCPKCGSAIKPNTKFCTYCGAKLQSANVTEIKELILRTKKERAETERHRMEREEDKKTELERIQQEKLQEERRKASIALKEKRRMEAEQEKKTTRIILAIILSLALAIGACIIYFALSSKSTVLEENTHKSNSNSSKLEYQHKNEDEDAYKSDDEEGDDYYDDDNDVLSYSESSSLNSVDLGLSVLWADCNIGASSATDNGWLIGWGTMDYQNFSKNLKEYPTSNPPHSISQTSYDVARAMYGGAWRLPTLEELKELKNECSWEVVSIDGVKVCKVTGPNGNHIYLPFAGYRDGTEVKREGTWGFIWSGELYEGNSQYASNLTFSVEGKLSTSGFYRYGGESIRPVISK